MYSLPASNNNFGHRRMLLIGTKLKTGYIVLRSNLSKICPNFQNKDLKFSEAHSEHCQTSEMRRLLNIVYLFIYLYYINLVKLQKLTLKDNNTYTELRIMYANLCPPNKILK